MRISTLALAIGLGFAAPLMVAAPATAQSVLQAPLSAQAQTIKAQLVALAQAGDTAGVRALMNQQVRAGNAADLAQAAGSMAADAQALAATDAAGAAAIVNAAVLVASNPSVSAADPTVSTVVGQSAQVIVSTVQSSDPNSAASIQTTVAVEGNVDVQVGYTTPITTTTTTPTAPTTPTVTETTTRPTQPTEPIVPIVPEPNPVQITIPVPVVPPQGQVAVNAQQGNPTIPQIGGGSSSSPT